MHLATAALRGRSPRRWNLRAMFSIAAGTVAPVPSTDGGSYFGGQGTTPSVTGGVLGPIERTDKECGVGNDEQRRATVREAEPGVQAGGRSHHERRALAPPSRPSSCSTRVSLTSRGVSAGPAQL